MANFDIANIALKMVCPNNALLTDAAGLPSAMVYIPAFKNSDVLAGGDDNLHPAFIVNGKEIPGFYYSKFQNVVHGGAAYSLPGEDPTVYTTFDKALEYCEAKGPGWHLSTAAEWAAIALWCKKNGFLPYGNNNTGKDSRENNRKAVPKYSSNSGTPYRVAAGTGPLTWSHDGTAAGIWDLNGNCNEWQGGIRLVWGELQILANNDAADPGNSQGETSTCWKAINAADGSLVDPESSEADTAVKASGNTVKVSRGSGTIKFYTGVSSPYNSKAGGLFGNVTCSDDIGNAAKVLLRSLALLPDEGAESTAYEGDEAYVIDSKDISGNTVYHMHRGGTWSEEEASGVFSLCMTSPRKDKGPSLTFRCSYIPELAKEA